MDEARATVPTAFALEIPARPVSSAKNRIRDLPTVSSLWSRTKVLAHTGTGPGESSMMIDKQNPHALYELMIMSAGRSVKPGLAQHSPAFARSVAAAGTAFAAHCRARELYPVLSWSYDPDTNDRESIQGEKRFHAHFTARTTAELEHVRAVTRPLSAYPVRQQRRLVDEATVLAGALTWPRLPAFRCLEPQEPLSSTQATASIVFRIPGGWHQLGTAFADLAAVHDVLQGIYNEVLSAWTTGRAGTWTRPVLRDRAQTELFTGSAGAALEHYLTALSAEAADAVTLGAGRDGTTNVYPLAGLAYSVTISEHEGEVHAHVRPVVFSDLGGAGATVIEGTITKITKNVGLFTPDESARFQREFLTELRCSPYGGPAFCPLLEAS